MNVLDDKDRAILAELQRDSRQTVQQLAGAVGLTRDAVLEARQGDGGRRRDPRLRRVGRPREASASRCACSPRST